MRQLYQFECKFVNGADGHFQEQEIVLYSAAYAGIGYLLQTAFENYLPWYTPLVAAIYPFVISYSYSD